MSLVFALQLREYLAGLSVVLAATLLGAVLGLRHLG